MVPREPVEDGEPSLDEPTVNFGETLFTAGGNEVGSIRGIHEDGIIVTTRNGVGALSVEHIRSGHRFGEAELVWRCISCGEMGPIEGGLPDTCPGCEGPREDLMYWTED